MGCQSSNLHGRAAAHLNQALQVTTAAQLGAEVGVRRVLELAMELYRAEGQARLTAVWERSRTRPPRPARTCTTPMDSCARSRKSASAAILRRTFSLRCLPLFFGMTCRVPAGQPLC